MQRLKENDCGKNRSYPKIWFPLFLCITLCQRGNKLQSHGTSSYQQLETERKAELVLKGVAKIKHKIILKWRISKHN